MEERQRHTLADQFAVVNSLNLGDLLKEQDEDETRQKRNTGGKTLLDIINEEQAAAAARNSDNNSNNRVKWKTFRARLKPRRSATRSCHSDEIPADPYTTIPTDQRTVPAGIQSNSPRNEPEVTETEATDSIQLNISLGAALAADREWRSTATAATETSRDEGILVVTDEIPVATNEVPGESASRVSLLALLEQADRSSAAVLAAEPAVEEKEGEGEREREREREGEEEGAACCVCMVRQKGAAFIPCGHTFCRRCSRELWVNRGYCPLCNGYILEILDIF